MEVLLWLKKQQFILYNHYLKSYLSAAIITENNPTKIDAIAFWDSYPPNSANLSNNSLPVLSINGTTNGILNPGNINDTQYLLPKNAVYAPIEGASHALRRPSTGSGQALRVGCALATLHMTVILLTMG